MALRALRARLAVGFQNTGRAHAPPPLGAGACEHAQCNAPRWLAQLPNPRGGTRRDARAGIRKAGGNDGEGWRNEGARNRAAGPGMTLPSAARVLLARGLGRHAVGRALWLRGSSDQAVPSSCLHGALSAAGAADLCLDALVATNDRLVRRRKRRARERSPRRGRPTEPTALKRVKRDDALRASCAPVRARNGRT